ncbi:GAF domain-containing protein [Okibacterium sp. HSC-33S16]|uniref:GAF and ANTAR domain-containing protein n=1 Tax=Okibacterium sp. HSC-33S16 TaxID=2910965 RepID=UPI00209CC5EE|nr:GAF and ANTAR domain-containing protein [Okibacterium sp. HSC-33S16]MCP2032512.1 GAF domain-containing protein [Okibacterium sp. HSC-33S16]
MSDGDVMSGQSREQKVSTAFVSMTDALMSEYDVIDLLSTLLHSSAEVLGMEAGGILLADPTGDLELVASTSEEAEIVETIIVAAGEGPCIECFETAAHVAITDIDTVADKWPKFHSSAKEQGFRSTFAVPMMLRDQVMGVMNLLSSQVHEVSEADGRIAQALADLAVLGILHERNFRSPYLVDEQLHLALDTRVLIEQAKGVLAQREDLTMTEAFDALRNYAHAEGTTLRRVAKETVLRTLTTEAIMAAHTETASTHS